MCRRMQGNGWCHPQRAPGGRNVGPLAPGCGDDHSDCWSCFPDEEFGLWSSVVKFSLKDLMLCLLMNAVRLSGPLLRPESPDQRLDISKERGADSRRAVQSETPEQTTPLNVSFTEQAHAPASMPSPGWCWRTDCRTRSATPACGARFRSRQACRASRRSARSRECRQWPGVRLV